VFWYHNKKAENKVSTLRLIKINKTSTNITSDLNNESSKKVLKI
tara:strand:- start:581 stop:712 length:132 start_codon:yes stop_codon:yes gene_type:complete